jgi:carbamoyl-phosphate synthase/aspartate carbamoyltransferase/dihydroorotase
MITLPGLIDIHVHLRDPGQTAKEDFFTGTSAALAGGFTTVIDMPNNTTPITSEERLDEKRKIAQSKTVCDIGFHFGSLGDNLQEFKKVQNKVFGLKLYLNQTTGGFIVTPKRMAEIYAAWNSKKPVLLHSEEEMVGMVLEVIRKTGQPSHFCHVSSKNELSQIIKAKNQGLPVTCGVCPHHLFLTEDDVKKLGPFGMMKPPLKNKSDVNFLWENLQYVDVMESDHAPHTLDEKKSASPPFGVPGLETTLPLLLTAVHEKRLTLDDVIRLCFESPKSIFSIPADSSTKVELDFDSEYTIQNKNLKTKCAWTPFDGWKAKGKVLKVFIRGKKVYENGEVLAEAGSGKVL